MIDPAERFTEALRIVAATLAKAGRAIPGVVAFTDMFAHVHTDDRLDTANHFSAESGQQHDQPGRTFPEHQETESRKTKTEVSG